MLLSVSVPFGEKQLLLSFSVEAERLLCKVNGEVWGRNAAFEYKKWYPGEELNLRPKV